MKARGLEIEEDPEIKRKLSSEVSSKLLISTDSNSLADSSVEGSLNDQQIEVMIKDFDAHSSTN